MVPSVTLTNGLALERRLINSIFCQMSLDRQVSTNSCMAVLLLTRSGPSDENLVSGEIVTPSMAEAVTAAASTVQRAEELRELDMAGMEDGDEGEGGDGNDPPGNTLAAQKVRGKSKIQNVKRIPINPICVKDIDEIGNAELAQKDLIARRERRLAMEKREDEALYYELGDRLTRMQGGDSVASVEEEEALTIDYLPPTDLSWVKYLRQFTIYRDEP
jgi:hypothetical protein